MPFLLDSRCQSFPAFWIPKPEKKTRNMNENLFMPVAIDQVENRILNVP
jgi:hypothetical protein